MPSASSLTERLRRLAPEAIAFGIIGAGNTLLYLAIYWVAMPIGPVRRMTGTTGVRRRKRMKGIAMSRF